MKGNLLFVNGCFPKEYENFLVQNSKVMPQNAANVLSWRLIEGLEENIPGRFHVLTCPFIGYFPGGFTKWRIPDKVWSHNGVTEDSMLGFINIKGLETWIKSVRIYRYVKKWYKKSEDNRAVLFYSHYAGFLRAAGKIKRKMPDMHLTCLVTDMPEVTNVKEETLLQKVKAIPRNVMFHITYKNLNAISSFVLLAKDMKEPLGVGERPYVVVEGISDTSMNPDEVEYEGSFPKTKDEFRVVYTGTLHKRYGVVTLSEAFSLLKEHKNLSLYICGSGDGEEEVQKLASGFENIHFLGILPHEQALSLQKSADLLVNPRPPVGLYTGLSFPSKTMEYMAMKKPMVCFKLKGIPDDYDGHLMYFEHYTKESMAEKIFEIYRMPRETLNRIAEENYQFACEEKGPKSQLDKIIRMMEGN